MTPDNAAVHFSITQRLVLAWRVYAWYRTSHMSREVLSFLFKESAPSLEALSVLFECLPFGM